MSCFGPDGPDLGYGHNSLWFSKTKYFIAFGKTQLLVKNILQNCKVQCFFIAFFRNILVELNNNSDRYFVTIAQQNLFSFLYTSNEISFKQLSQLLIITIERPNSMCRHIKRMIAYTRPYPVGNLMNQGKLADHIIEQILY